MLTCYELDTKVPLTEELQGRVAQPGINIANEIQQ